ncbi:MAG TPA: enoyl-CoA hydratase-related protein [Acidimicrobiales bacterium]|nr:enoyl-CoA hydratase-related protein [Acidimicrobiales bacterium]
MTDFANIQYSEHDETVTITLSRPERRNALTLAMIEEIITALSRAGDSDALGVILAAQGPVWCTGHDFSEMLNADITSVRHLFSRCTRMMETIQEIPQPVIAKVHALATGAGCQLVASADLAVASVSASFATPGGRGGLFCTTPLVAVARAIPRKRALEMGLTGDAISATTAEQWGLVNAVVDDEFLDRATAELLARVTRGSVESRAIGKAAFYRQIGLAQRDAYDVAVEVMAQASLIPDSQESIRAFLEKRPPRWRSSPAHG